MGSFVYGEVVAAEDAADHEDVEAVKARVREHRADHKAKWETLKKNVTSKVSGPGGTVGFAPVEDELGEVLSTVDLGVIGNLGAALEPR